MQNNPATTQHDVKMSQQIDTTNADTIKQGCNEYLSSRVSDYEFRCRRYDAVIRKMIFMGLRNSDTVLDFGCGRQDLKRRLSEWGFSLSYQGVDGSINGVDLNCWLPPGRYDFIVAVEVLEHLENPSRLLSRLPSKANKGVVVTTPNPLVVDVIGCDPTHISIVRPGDLMDFGYEWSEESLFGMDRDSLVGWKRSN